MKKAIIYSAVALSTTILSLIPINGKAEPTLSSLTSSSTETTESSSEKNNNEAEKAQKEAEQKQKEEEKLKKEQEEQAKKEQEKAEKEKEKAQKEQEEQAKKDKEATEKAKKETEEANKEKAKQEEKAKATATYDFPTQEVANSSIAGAELENMRTTLLLTTPENADFRNCAIYMLNTGETDANKCLTANCGAKYKGVDVKSSRATKYSFTLSDKELSLTLEQLRYKINVSENYGVAIKITNLGNMYQLDMIEVFN